MNKSIEKLFGLNDALNEKLTRLTITSLVDDDTPRFRDDEGNEFNGRLVSDNYSIDGTEAGNIIKNPDNTEEVTKALQKMFYKQRSLGKQNQAIRLANLLDKDTSQLTGEDFENVHNYEYNNLINKLSGQELEDFDKSKVYEKKGLAKEISILAKIKGTDNFGRPLLDIINPNTNKSILDEMIEDKGSPKYNLNAPVNFDLQSARYGGNEPRFIENSKVYNNNWLDNVTDTVQSSGIKFTADLVSGALNAVLPKGYYDEFINWLEQDGSHSFLRAADPVHGQAYADAFAGLDPEVRRKYNQDMSDAFEDFKEGNYGSALLKIGKNLDMIFADSSASMASLALPGGIAKALGAGIKTTRALVEAGTGMYAATATKNTVDQYKLNTGTDMPIDEVLSAFVYNYFAGAIDRFLLDKGFSAVGNIAKNPNKIMSNIGHLASSGLGEAIQEPLEQVGETFFSDNKYQGFNDYLRLFNTDETKFASFVGGLSGLGLSGVGAGAGFTGRAIAKPLDKGLAKVQSKIKESKVEQPAPIQPNTPEYFVDTIKQATESFRQYSLDKTSPNYTTSAQAVHQAINELQEYSKSHPEIDVTKLLNDSGITRAELVEAIQANKLGSPNAELTPEMKDEIHDELAILGIEDIYTDMATATNEYGQIIMGEELKDLAELEQAIKDNNNAKQDFVLKEVARRFNNKFTKVSEFSKLLSGVLNTNSDVTRNITTTRLTTNGYESFEKEYRLSKALLNNNKGKSLEMISSILEEAIILKKYNDHLKSKGYITEDLFTEENSTVLKEAIDTLSTIVKSKKQASKIVKLRNSYNLVFTSTSEPVITTQEAPVAPQTNENKKSEEVIKKDTKAVTEQPRKSEEVSEEVVENTTQSDDTFLEYIEDEKVAELQSKEELTTQDSDIEFLNNLDKELSIVQQTINSLPEVSEIQSVDITSTEYTEEELDEDLDFISDDSEDLSELDVTKLEPKDIKNDFTKDASDESYTETFENIITFYNDETKLGSKINKSIHKNLSVLITNLFKVSTKNSLTIDKIINTINELKNTENNNDITKAYKQHTLHNITILTNIINSIILSNNEDAIKRTDPFKSDVIAIKNIERINKALTKVKSEKNIKRLNEELKEWESKVFGKFKRLSNIKKQVIIDTTLKLLDINQYIDKLYSNFIPASTIKSINNRKLHKYDTKFDLAKVFAVKLSPESMYSIVDITPNSYINNESEFIRTNLDLSGELENRQINSANKNIRTKLITGYNSNPISSIFRTSDGEANSNITAIVTDTAYEFVRNNSNNYFNSDEDNVNKIFKSVLSGNKAKGDKIGKTILTNYGVPITNLTNVLGKAAMKKLGVKKTNDARFNDYAAMQSALGNMILQYMIAKGILTVSKHDSIIIKNKKVPEKIPFKHELIFVKLNHNKYKEYTEKHEKGWYNSVGSNSDISMNITNLPKATPIKATRETFFSKLKNWKYSWMVNRIFNRYRKTPFKIQRKSVQWIREHQDVLKKYMEYVNREDIKNLSYDDQISVAGYYDPTGKYDKPFTGFNGQIERSIENLLNADDTFQDNPVYFNWKLGSNGRITIEGSTLMPQGDKLHRMLVLNDNAICDLDINNKEDMENLYYTLASAFDQLGTKEDIEYFGKSLLEFVKNKDNLAKLKKAFDEGTIDNITIPSIFTLKKIEYKLEYESVGHLIQAMQTLENYSKAANARKHTTFQCVLPVEIDATASGYAQRLLNYPVVELLKKFGPSLGLFFDGDFNPEDTVKSVKVATGTKDLYEWVASEGKVDIQGLADQWYAPRDLDKEGSIANNLLLAMKPLLPEVGKDGKVSSALRKIAKPAVMIFGYSAGKYKIMQGVTKAIYEGIINDFLKGKNGTAIREMFSVLIDNGCLLDSKNNPITSLDGLKIALKSMPLYEIRLSSKDKGNLNQDNLEDLLFAYINDTYTTSIYDVLDREFAELSIVNKAINTYAAVTTDNLEIPFTEMYNSLIKDGKTEEEAKKIIDEALELLLPRVGSPLGNMVSNENDVTTVPLYNTSHVSQSDYGNAREVWWKTKSRYKVNNKDFYINVTPEIRVPSSVAAATAVDQIHALDASGLIRALDKTYKELGYQPMSIHDALIGSVKDFNKIARHYNKQIFLCNKEFSLFDSLIKNADKVQNTLEDILNDTTDKYNPYIKQLAKSIANPTGSREEVYSLKDGSTVKTQVPNHLRLVVNANTKEIDEFIEQNPSFAKNEDWRKLPNKWRKNSNEPVSFDYYISPRLARALLDKHASMYESTRNEFYKKGGLGEQLHISNMDSTGKGNYSARHSNTKVIKSKSQVIASEFRKFNIDKSLNAYSKYSIETDNADVWAEFASTNTDAVLEILNDCFLMDGNVSEELQNEFRELINQFDLSILDKVKLLIKKRSDIEGAVGSYDTINKTITINVNFDRTNFNTVTNLSTTEVFIHELVHALTAATISNANSMEANSYVKRLSSLMSLVQNKLDYTSFLPENNTSQEAITQAKGYWNYIFSNNTSTRRLAEFTAMAITNPNFRKALSKLRHKREKKNLVQLIKEIFVGLARYFKGEGKFYDIFPHLDAIINGEEQIKQKDVDTLSAMETLVTDITKANAKALSKTNQKFQLFSNVFEALSIMGDEGNNLVRNLAKRIFNNKLLNKLNLTPYDPNKTWNIYQKAAWWSALAAGNFVLPSTRKYIMIILNLAKMKHESLLGSIIKQFSSKDACDKFIQNIRALLNNKERMAKTSYTTTISSLEAIFANDNLKDSDKVSIYKGLLKTDLSSLLDNGYSIDKIKSLLQDDNTLQQEIDILINNIKRSYSDTKKGNKAIGLADILAHYMVTGEGNELLHFNAQQIANEVDKTNTLSIKSIDNLVSLLALQKTDVNHKNVLSNLSNNSLTHFFNYHNSFKQKMNKKLNVGTHNEIKGYTKEEIPNNQQLVAVLSDRQKLEEDGYKFIKELTIDDTNEKFGLFINTNERRGAITGGAFSLQSFKPKGISTFNIMYNHNGGNETAAKIRAKVIKNVASVRRTNMLDLIEKQGIVSRAELNKLSNGFVPTYNENGKIADFRYELSQDIKENELGMSIDGFEVFANMYKSMNYEYESIESNLALLKYMMDESDREVNKNYSNFVDKNTTLEYEKFSFDSDSEFVREQIKTLPKYIRDAIKKHNRPIWVRKDRLSALLGTREMSLANAKFIENNKNLKKYLRPIIIEIEDALKTITSITASNVVIKTLAVITGNIIGNTFTLMMEGYPIHKIIRYQVAAIKNIKSYMKNEHELNIIEAKMRYKTATQKDLERRKILIGNLEMNPEYDLIKGGAWTTIAEDIDLNSKLPTVGKLTKLIESKVKIPSVLKSILKQIYVTEDTKIYNMLLLATQFGDYSARSAMHKFEMEKCKHRKGTLEYDQYNKEMVNKALNTFINYDDPASPMQNYANRIGIVMFVKFFLRVQPIVRRLLWEKPFTSIVTLLFSGLLGMGHDNILYQIPFLGKDVTNLFHNHIETLCNALIPGWGHLLGYNYKSIG